MMMKKFDDIIVCFKKITLKVSNYGITLTSLLIPTQSNEKIDIILGY